MPRIQVDTNSHVTGNIRSRPMGAYGQQMVLTGTLVSPFYGNEPRPCRLSWWQHPSGKITGPSGGETPPLLEVDSGTHHGWVLHNMESLPLSYASTSAS